MTTSKTRAATLWPTRARSSRLHGLRLAFILSVSLPAMAAAQEHEPPGIAPARETIDENGVDLSRGILVDRVHSVSIGEPSDPGMVFARSVVSNGDYRDSTSGTLTVDGSKVTANVAGSTETFTLSGGNYSSDERSGSTLTQASGTYTYKLADGTTALFSLVASRMTYATGTHVITSLTRPNGEAFTYHYRTATVCAHYIGGNCVANVSIGRIQAVSSNRGYMLRLGFENDDESPEDLEESQPWMTINNATLINTSVDYCSPSASTCTYSISWPTLAMNGTNSFTDSLNRVTTYTFASGRMTAIQRPGATSANVAIAYDGSGKVSSVTRDGVATTYGYSDVSGVRTTTVNAAGPEKRIVKFDLTHMQRISDEDALGNVTTFTYDSTTRLLTKITAPELNATEFAHDARGNLTSITAKPKPNSSLADIVRQISYPASDTSFPERCATGIAGVLCNQPTSTTDARGNVTNYSYDSTHGGVTAVTSPAPATEAVRPETRFTYSSLSAWYKDASGALVQAPSPIYRLTAVSTCQTTSSCANGADEVRTTIAYQAGSSSAASNLLPASITSGNGSFTLAATSAIAYDPLGNVLTVDGPLASTDDIVRHRYDVARQRVGSVSPDPDGTGSLKHRAQRVTYNLDGQPTKVESGNVDSQSDGDWAAFAPLEQVETAYDANGRPVTAKLVSGSTIHALVQTSYDARGRAECTAQRMNAAEYGALPSSACTLDTEGGFGPDRIGKRVFDDAGRVTQVKVALGTSSEANEVTATYGANGPIATVTDAEGNKTTYEYDDHIRLANTRYPSPTTDGVSAPTSGTGADFEQLGYDAGSNVVSFRNRAGETANFTYDNLNRVTAKDLPGSEPDVAYTYDNLSRLTGASQSGHALTFTYDALGRNLTQVGPQGTVTSEFDLAGRRTRITHPDTFYVDQDYLVTGEVSAIRENGATSGVGVLATFAYDNLGRRTTLTRGNSTTTSYTFDAVSRLASLVDNPAGTTHDQTLGFSYNPASEIVSNTRSNDAFAFVPANVTRNDTFNGLNQLTAKGATSLTHDTRGNITYDGTKTFGYSSENLLTSATGSVTLAYDPMLRLYQTAGAATTRFAYDGSDMIAEFNGSNALQRRFVHGPGVDEPLVWYEGSGTTDRRFLHADERGSIMAVSNGSGTVTNVNSYDEYGAPAAANTGRFQYTGQTWIGELGLYDYKARMYNPWLPRFQQPDPIGYGSGMNLYGYVGGNPVNFTDPSGLSPRLECTTSIFGGGTSIDPDGAIVVALGQRVQECDWVDFGNGRGDYFRERGIGPSTGDWGPLTAGGGKPDQCVGARFSDFFRENGLPASLVAFGRESDPTFLLGLSAYESSWGDSDSARLRNNPFGATPRGDATRGLTFRSTADAWAWWDATFGPRIQGTSSDAATFVDGLLQDNRNKRNAVDNRGAYNSENSAWRSRVLETIESARKRWGRWLANGC